MATIKDVSEKAGVTVTTVSRVINNRGYISEKTRQKVYAAMKELDYQPNELARSLSKQCTNTIGIIVPHIVHPYFAKLISNIEMAASGENYKVMLWNTKEETEKELEYIEMCKSNRVSGIILCSQNIDMNKMSALDIPLITIERHMQAGTAGIECDNYQGGILAAEYLISCGCKRLMHFGGVLNADMPADARTEAFMKVCREQNVFCFEVQSDKSIYQTMDYYFQIKKALNQYPDTDGIFASSDLIAAQVIQVCAEMKIEIPRQLKLIGFDDVNIAKLTTPQITTIRQPLEEMAQTAVSYIIQSLRGEKVPKKTKLPVTLVKRGTA